MAPKVEVAATAAPAASVPATVTPGSWLSEIDAKFDEFMDRNTTRVGMIWGRVSILIMKKIVDKKLSTKLIANKGSYTWGEMMKDLDDIVNRMFIESSLLKKGGF
jgi:hypothetical protein